MLPFGNLAPMSFMIDFAILPMTGIGKLKAISEWRQLVGTSLSNSFRLLRLYQVADYRTVVAILRAIFYILS